MPNRLITPSQLALFSRSPVIGAWWEELHAQGLFRQQRPATTPLDELLFKQGHKHEEVLLKRLEDEGKDVYRQQPLDPDGPPQEQDYANTRAAMQQGRQYIHQAALKNNEIRGWADLLERIERPSKLGDWSYIPIECKLSSHPKPIYLVQACAYCELLELILGERPEHFKLYLGGRRFEQGEHGYPTARFWSWYEQLRQRYRDFRAAFDPSQEPDDARGDHGLWEPFIEQRLQQKRDLILVAGLRGSQRDKLRNAGIHTIEQLAALPEQGSVPGMNHDVLKRLREQACIQLETRENDERPAFRVRPIDEQAGGLALLPAPDDGDIWFDMEGYPDPIKGEKLEYLFGACYRDQAGDLQFKPWWAHTMADEKQAFDSFIQWVEQRRLQHPNLHVYHYASYEKTALGNLAALHQIHEPLMDQWRATGVLVDLYPIVRRGLLLGADSYSIKKVERLYQPPRDGDVETAADSVVQYAEWLRSGEPSIAGDLPHGSPRLLAIERYNRDDCISTARLHAFLIENHLQLGLEFPSFDRRDGVADESQLEDVVEESPRAKANREAIEALMRASQILLEELPVQHRDKTSSIRPADENNRLLALSEADESAGPRGMSLRIQRLLSQLLPFHLRERKVEWWDFYARLEQSPEERLDDPEVIVAARLESDETRQLPRSRQRLLTYSFACDQPLKLNDGAGLSLYLTEAEIPLAAKLDEETGTVVLTLPDSIQQTRLQSGRPVTIPEQTDLILFPPDISQHLRPHLAVQAQRWVEGKDLPAAMLHLLERRRMPELEPINERTRHNPAGTAADLAAFFADADGVALSLQGPPGTGKTTVTAELIARLSAQGQRIAVSSNSHPAINHLLKQCQKAVDRRGGTAMVVKCTGSSARPDDESNFGGTAVSCALQKQLRPDMAVVGGTAYVFAKHDADPFDLLVIDEAGQVSLANLLAMARCARNILVVGDQQQLSQPTRAAHPEDSGLSCLDYMMADHAVVPADRGVFLATSWRMPPALTAVVSELFYEEQLQATFANEANRILWNAQPQGLIFQPVEHKGNSTGSDEEVEYIAKLVDELLGKPYQRSQMRNGKMRTEDDDVLGPSDILITAPYNIQVNRLQRILGDRARVGTVDKFQGQEAPVAIHSLTASDAESAPRGLDFLLSPNRLNVAISRAQCLSIVVGSPELATGISTSIANVQRLNRLCRLMAVGQGEER
ncbi:MULTISPECIES: TM0106 family RecB-like putative nuclease [Synechococcales]|uniref:TM0106 family RecB-like putative nuclease n=1 Tax=Synechococcales TaxID=1890424 RepID=UPI000B987E3A|nr:MULTISPECIES: TM0106 family RecB-like putative nuclease [Synechococcales]MCP9943028.1 TM0106 family RecB-like putative nuclease [Cyanobium sp. ATX 6E8]